jgi:hypothetical protein
MNPKKKAQKLKRNYKLNYLRQLTFFSINYYDATRQKLV